VLAGTEVVEPRRARRQFYLGIRELALKNGNGGREVALLALCERDATVDVGPDRGIRARLGPAHVADVAILTALTIAVVGSVAWEAGQLRMIWRLTTASTLGPLFCPRVAGCGYVVSMEDAAQAHGTFMGQ
jgi:hypothetical protein